MRVQTRIGPYFYILLVLCLVVLPADSAYAKTQEAEQTIEVSDTVKAATVNLYCRLKAGRKTYGVTGSGVFVSERGVILTNAHVAQYFLLPAEEGRVTGTCAVRGGSPARAHYTASMLYFPSTWVADNASELKKRQPKGTGENDFALLYVTGARKGALPNAFPALLPDSVEGAALGDLVTVAGYPSEGLDFKGVQSKLHMVAAESSVTDTNDFGRSNATDLITIAPSAAGQQGISGGPVIDAENEVIGIAAIKSAAKNNSTLRAITLSYIDRVLRTQTDRSLASLLTGDFKDQADETADALPDDTVTIITKSILQKK